MQFRQLDTEEQALQQGLRLRRAGFLAVFVSRKNGTRLTAVDLDRLAEELRAAKGESPNVR